MKLSSTDYNRYTPFTLTSTENFLSVYFRSSVLNSFRGFECQYEVLGDLDALATPAPTSTTPSGQLAVAYNGEPGCGVANTTGRIVGGNQVTGEQKNI